MRPDHLRPGGEGQLRGEVMVAERLGGATYLYVQLGGDAMVIVEADGEDPSRVHEQVAIQVKGEACHLFNDAGEAIPHLKRNPLADIKDPTAHAVAS